MEWRAHIAGMDHPHKRFIVRGAMIKIRREFEFLRNIQREINMRYLGSAHWGGKNLDPKRCLFYKKI